MLQYIIYNLIIVALSPVLYVYFAYCAAFDHRYTGTVLRRLGRGLGRPGEGAIWLHAVSVGEAVGATPLIRMLLERDSGRPLVVTTSTRTGMEVLEKEFGDSITSEYFPLDFPWVVSRFQRAFRPSALILMETEIWPNLIAACRRRGTPVVLLNGRVSDRMAGARGFVRALYSHVFSGISAIGMQAEKDAARMRELGAPGGAVHVVGNIKFDGILTKLDGARVEELRKTAAADGASLLVAGSTHPGEEEMVLDAYKQLKAAHPGLRLVIAPRHIERSDEVARVCRDAGFAPAMRTAHSGASPAAADVVVWDTIGELRYLYSVAAACFVGGSLVERGGHNILEPAACGRAAFYGPHMMNFRASVEALEAGGGGVCVKDAGELAARVGDYLGDAELKNNTDEAALAVVKANAGAAERAYELFKRSSGI